MSLALATLLLAQTALPAQSAGFAGVLRIDHPAKRKSALRALRKVEKRSFAEWRTVLAKLSKPPLPLADAQPGTIDTRRVGLWAGPKERVLQTEISFRLPRRVENGKTYPLLVCCHVTGGNARSAISQWLGIADGLGLILIAATEQKDNRGYHGKEYERQTQLSLLRWAKLHLPVDADRAFLTGVSRGGHIAWDVATRVPDLWAGVAPMIGGPRLNTIHGENNLRFVENLLDVPIRDLQGEQDDPGLLFNLRIAFKKLEGARDAKFITFPELGHSFKMSAVDWNAFFANTRRPVPSRLRFWCAGKVHARRAWLRVTRLDRSVKDAYRPQVKETVWKNLDNDGRKRWVVRDADKHTASIDVRIQGGADERIVVVGKVERIRSFELLLPPLLWSGENPKAKLFVKAKGRKRRIHPKRALETFLLDFSERVDLSTAPAFVATVRL